MATEPGKKAEPAEAKGASSEIPRTRSPNFPLFSLRKAVERTELIHKAAKKFSVSAETALKSIGYSSTTSSSALQTIGALKAYGLIETEGSGPTRKVAVSEAGAQIVLGHPERANLLKKAALMPPLFAQIWALQTDDGMPPDDVIRHHLLWDLKFNDAAIPTFIAAFRDTLAYAGLNVGDKVISGAKTETEDGVSGVAPKIGDLIQWTSMGIDMFEKPMPLRGFSEDGSYAFVPGLKDGGTDSGIPVDEITIVERGMPEAEKKPAPPPNPFASAGAVVPKTASESPPPAGLREDVYDLTGGRAVLRYPATLDVGSVEELEEWLELIVRKMRRMNSIPAKTDPSKPTG